MPEEAGGVLTMGGNTNTQMPLDQEFALQGRIACTEMTQDSRVANDGSSISHHILYDTGMCIAALAPLLGDVTCTAGNIESLNGTTLLKHDGIPAINQMLATAILCNICKGKEKQRDRKLPYT